MTALASIQKDWIKNTEDGLVTGLLVLDLSAAFDTMDCCVFQKLVKIHNNGHKSVMLEAWNMSNLNDISYI